MEAGKQRVSSVRVGRVVLFFAYCFGCFLLPFAAAMFLFLAVEAHDPYVPDSAKLQIDENQGLFLTPEAVLGTEDFRHLPDGGRFGAAAGIQARFSDGCEVTVLAAESAAGLDSLRSAVRASLNYSSVSSTPGETWYTLRETGRRVFLTAAGDFLLLGEGEGKSRVRQALEDLPGFAKNPEAAAAGAGFDKALPYILGAVAAYCLLQIFIWPRLASWAAKVPAADANPLLPEELKRRLLAINDLDLPFHVREGRRGRYLFVEWKYADADWAGLFSAAGMRSVYSMKLRLPKSVDDRRVRTLDRSYGFRWDAAAGKGVLSGGFAASFFRGIHFAQYEGGFVYGLIYDKGRLQLKPYEWRFNIREIKNPVVEIVTGAGYDFFPVITFNRLING